MNASENASAAHPCDWSAQSLKRLRCAARRSVQNAIAGGIEHYDRETHLPRLIPLEPKELADGRIEARRRLLARLARALRAERNRGRAGHWTYDLNRHIGLKQAYSAERQALAAMRRTTPIVNRDERHP
jgi:hypothetical protein